MMAKYVVSKNIFILYYKKKSLKVLQNLKMIEAEEFLFKRFHSFIKVKVILLSAT
jgi:hypothetical protein